MEKKHVKFVIRIIDENENPITKPIKVYIEGEIMGGKEVKTENRSTNIKETHIKTTEEKSVKAVIQAIDEKENPIGKPVEVYDYAVLVEGEKRVKVKDKHRTRHYTSELIVIKSSLEEIPLSGVYQEFKRESVPKLLIDVQNDKVIVWYLHYYYYKYSSERIYCRRKSEEKVYQPMKTRGVLREGEYMDQKKYQLMRAREVLREGEYVDLIIPDTYREIGRKGNVPIVDENVMIRIYAKRLEKELYQQ